MYNCTAACNYVQAAVQVRGTCNCTIVHQPVTVYRLLYRWGRLQLYKCTAACNYVQAAVQEMGAVTVQVYSNL